MTKYEKSFNDMFLGRKRISEKRQIEIARDLLELVERDKPKKANRETGFVWDNSCYIYTCPICGTLVSDIKHINKYGKKKYIKDKFCSNCGQRLEHKQ